MKKLVMLSLLALGLTGPVLAENIEIPLAVTGTAHPSLLKTPTSGQRAKSDQYLKAGLIFMQKGSHERAVQELQDSVRLAPRAENYQALGTAYFNAGNSAKAAWAYRESLQLKPDDKIQALIENLEGRDHPEERFANKSDELSYAAKLKQAKDFEKAGKIDKALRAWAEAAALMPGSEAREPQLRIHTQRAEKNLKAKHSELVLRDLNGFRTAFGDGKDLSEQEYAYLGRAAKVEEQYYVLDGAKAREREVAGQSDEYRWTRKMLEKAVTKWNGSLGR